MLLLWKIPITGGSTSGPQRAGEPHNSLENSEVQGSQKRAYPRTSFCSSRDEQFQLQSLKRLASAEDARESRVTSVPTATKV